MPRQVTSGTMRTQIVLQSPSTTTNSRGEVLTTYADAATVWAEATPVRARDVFAAGKEQLPVDTVFRVRYRAGVTAAWRVRWRGDNYELHGEPVDVDGGRRTLELAAIKGVRDGR
jgi:SPP1 family predicted phage head-tail adaptor